MTPEDRLVRSLPALRELIDSLAGRSASEASDLLRLDVLVRKYPAAARTSLCLAQRSPDAPPAPAGWSSVPDPGGLPWWRWAGGRICVATGDMDQLRFIGAALDRFDQMTAEELHAHVRWPSGRPGGGRSA